LSAVVLIIHLLIALALIAVVLLQRSEGGALGIGGGGGGAGSLFSSRGTANVLTRATAFLAAAFFVTSITLAILAGGTRAPGSIFDGRGGGGSVLPQLPGGDATTPAPAPAPQSTAPSAPATPPAPSGPQVPLDQ
jgi:preprotein translocase subunit SecG